MWPLDWRKRRERRDLHRLFSAYLSKHQIEDALAATPSSWRHMESKEIHFLLLQVRDDDLGDAQDLIAKAVSAAIESSGVVECIMSSIVLVTFGLVGQEPRRPGELQAGLADALLERMGSNVRIAYGRARGLHGNLGSDKRFDYTALLPGFGRLMETLLSSEFGGRVVVGEGRPTAAGR